MIDLHDNQIEELGNYFQLKVGVETVTKPIYIVLKHELLQERKSGFLFSQKRKPQ